MRDDELNTPAFLDLLRAGDPEAFRRMIRRLHGSLVGTATAIIGSRAQAEEIVQDAWLAVFSGIGRFEGRSSLTSWVFTIVLNRARTRISREGRTVALPDGMGAGADSGERAVPLDRFAEGGHWLSAPKLWDELDPERVVSGRQLWVHVQEAIEKLPAGQKAVIILRDIEGEEPEAACALLGITPENQRVLLHRARGKVRAAIEALMLTATPVQAAPPRRPMPAKAAQRAGNSLARRCTRLIAAAQAFAGRCAAQGRACSSSAPSLMMSVSAPHLPTI
jgi:RNA polymerase sigma-70 factor (ECF subfamily)